SGTSRVMPGSTSPRALARSSWREACSPRRRRRLEATGDGRASGGMIRGDADRGGAPAAAGIGLRAPHVHEVIDTRPPTAWLELLCRHVDQTQIALGRQILIENPSSYLRFRHSPIPEPEFLAELARRTGCGLLCDVNNIYVSAHNLGFDAMAYVDALPRAAVSAIHV